MLPRSSDDGTDLYKGAAIPDSRTSFNKSLKIIEARKAMAMEIPKEQARRPRSQDRRPPESGPASSKAHYRPWVRWRPACPVFIQNCPNAERRSGPDYIQVEKYNTVPIFKPIYESRSYKVPPTFAAVTLASAPKETTNRSRYWRPALRTP
jgi:hypothetical protein